MPIVGLAARMGMPGLRNNIIAVVFPSLTGLYAGMSKVSQSRKIITDIRVRRVNRSETENVVLTYPEAWSTLKRPP